MNTFDDLFWLLGIGAAIGLWLKLLRARELAVDEARRLCKRHGLQLLDETVGMRSIRLRRHDGRLRVERSYGFEVSTDGHDREPGRLSMIGDRVIALVLPAQAIAADGTTSNVVLLRRPDSPPRLH